MPQSVPDQSDPDQERATIAGLFDRLIEHIPDDCQLNQVTIGLHWTGVVLELKGQLHCGLASTVVGHHAHGEVDNVGSAGELGLLNPRQLAGMIHSPSPTERSIGLATINAALSSLSPSLSQADALEVMLSRGRGKTIGLIGHFPFIPRLQSAAEQLYVLEMEPGPGELPAEAAPEILPQCDLIAITSMTLINGSFEGLLPLLPADSFSMLLGPSTPLSASLFELGIDMLAGSYVTKIEAVMTALGQGANYRQLHEIGTRLVALEADR